MVNSGLVHGCTGVGYSNSSLFSGWMIIIWLAILIGFTYLFVWIFQNGFMRKKK